MPKLIVSTAFVLVGENLVRLGAFLEERFRLGLVAIGAVGMILHRQAAIGALDLVARGRSRDTKHFVIVSFCRGHFRT